MKFQHIAGRVRAKTASAITVEHVEYVVEPFIPRARLSRIDGYSGLGKSMVCLDIAARLSRGEDIDGDELPNGPESSLMISAEDSEGELRRRLEHADADLSVIHVVDPDTIDLPADSSGLEKMIEQTGATLVVIDPFVAFLNSRLDSHRDHDVRQALRPLMKVAERTGAAVVLVGHLNKSTTQRAVHRVNGSGGLVNAGRVASLVVEDPTDRSKRVLTVTKSNFGRAGSALRFQIEPVGSDPDVVHVVWLDRLVMSADEALQDHVPSKLDKAKRMLLSMLDGGGCPKSEVQQEARRLGISDRTLEEAKAQLGVRDRRLPPRDGRRGHGGSWWYLDTAKNSATGSPGKTAEFKTTEPEKRIRKLRLSSH